MDNKSFEDWMQILLGRFDKIDKTLERMNKLKECFDGDTLLDNRDVCILLKKSKKQLQHLRTSGQIAFFKLDNKVYYRESDIQEYIKQQKKG